jgi:hypothetical protein
VRLITSAAGVEGEGDVVGCGERDEGERPVEGERVGLVVLGLRLSLENMRIKFWTRPALSGVFVGVRSAIVGQQGR